MPGLYVVYGVGCRHVVASAADPAVFVPLLATLAAAGRPGFGVGLACEVDTVQGCCDHCTLTVTPPTVLPATPVGCYDRDPVGTVRRCPITGDLYTRVGDQVGEPGWIALYVDHRVDAGQDSAMLPDATDLLSTEELPPGLVLLEPVAAPAPRPVVAEVDLGDEIDMGAPVKAAAAMGGSNRRYVLPPVARPQCGTDAGWYQHKRRDELPDPACDQAHLQADREAHRRRRGTWAIRQWCLDTGRPVAGVGPIPRRFVDAYLAAHPVRPASSAPLPIVREWALREGYPVSGRGLLPDQVIDAYNPAHPGGGA